MSEESIKLENYLLDLLNEKKITLTELSSVTQKIIENYTQETFPNVKVGWYAFANGKFSADKKAYENLLGVVAWVNSDRSALKGSRGLILLPDALDDVWQTKKCLTNTSDKDNGEENTEKCKQAFLKNKASFPLVDWCQQYNKRTKQKAFIPAINQLLKIAENVDVINISLKGIKSPLLKGWVMSSTECNQWRQYAVCFPYVLDGACGKSDSKIVKRVVIAF